MQKLNKSILRIVAALLCMVLLSTSILSGIFAKFVIQKKTDLGTVAFKKWGITIEPGSDLNAQYKKNGDTIVINSSTEGSKLIAPGTNGCIAYFKVIADNPEVKFNIDFNGTATIGTGYKADSKYIRDPDGTPIEYFPIIFYLVAYDLNADGTVKGVVTDNNLKGYIMDFTVADRDSKGNGVVGHNENDRVFSFKTFDNVEKQFNGQYSGPNFVAGSLNNVFDSPVYNAGKSFERVYTLQWCWPYNESDTSYRKSSYKVGTYQTQWRDTQLGEAMLKNPSAFNISFDVEMTITQAANS